MTKTIVCVSPLRLDRDSRSHRAALSFQRFGHQVVVVEGESSAIDSQTPPFPLITLNGRASAPNKSSGNGRTPGAGHLRRLLRGPLWEICTFVWFLFQVFVVNVVRGLWRVPRADLYYLHEYQMFPMIYLQAKRHGAKIVYDAHDFYPGVHADADLTPFWRHVFRPFLVWLERLCINRVNGMVTVNQGIADLYKETFGVEALVTRNCHDPEMDVAVDQGLRERLGLLKTDFLLVTIGNSKPGQHVAPALEAMSRLTTDVHLVFVGRGYESLAEDIPALGLGGRVHIVPPVPANKVVPFIRTADAALILYYARSSNDVHFLPNGFFQAIAARLPVLYPGLRWIKETGDAFGIGVEIDPADADSIFTGIEGLRKRIVADGMGDILDRAASETSWRTEEHVLKELTGHVLEDRRNA
ncbi:MAG: glycosyltransferase [Rhodospirillales bacterium]|nr:glycosyltransferase [Rhodospirillales bacterium]